MTKELKKVGPFRFLFWTDGGMQNGYLLEDTTDGTQSGLFCDSETAEYFEHVMQLGYGDCIAECEDIIQPWREMTR
jgi:hypothetical protein